jgi:hypothetical protein
MRTLDILKKVLDKKVFTIEELTEEFYEFWKGILPKSVIKKRITDFLALQLKAGLVKKLYTNGHNYTIFGTKEATEKDLEAYLPVCKICGKKFYPTQHNQEICSVKCKREYVRRFKRAKKGYLPDDRHYRPWSKEEEELVLKTFKHFRFSLEKAEELAKVLKRHPSAIKKRLYILKKLKEKSLGGCHAN